jgi:hypothetical protein
MIQSIIVDVAVDDGGCGDVCILKFRDLCSCCLGGLDSLLEMVFLRSVSVNSS